MPMADLKQLEFYLLRYVPIRGEGRIHKYRSFCWFEPHALMVFGFADVRMTSDWRRVTCLDRQVDIEVLQALEPYIRTQLKHPQDVGSLLHKFGDSFASWSKGLRSARVMPVGRSQPERFEKAIFTLFGGGRHWEVVARHSRPKE